MSDGVDPRTRRRTRWAVALLLVGFAVAFVPGLAASDRFVRSIPGLFVRVHPNQPDAVTDWVEVADSEYFSMNWDASLGTSAAELVRTDFGWAIAAATLSIAPLLFAWWQLGGPSFGRHAGVVCAVVASISVCVFVARMSDTSRLFPDGVWWTVPAGGALMATAFVIAPAPRRRDE